MYFPSNVEEWFYSHYQRRHSVLVYCFKDEVECVVPCLASCVAHSQTNSETNLQISRIRQEYEDKYNYFKLSIFDCESSSDITGMLLPKITIYQLQDFHLSSRYQNENANRIIFIQHIVTHDACMRS